MIFEKINKLLNMKLQSINILASAVLLMAFASCKKDLIKTNTDPNSVSVDAFDPNNILTATQLYYTGSTDNAIEVEETEIQGAGCMIQHWASTSTYFFGDKYIGAPTSGGWGSFFDHTYTSTIKNAVNLYTITTGKPQYKNLHQIARIIKAMAFERITDVYGDVPYFQAGQAYNKGIYFPKYDKQKDIYADLLKEVEQATDSLDANADKPAGDLFYSQAGDQIGEWKKFGHTLLLRMAMRLTKVDPATAKAYVTKLQGLTMTSNDDNAIVAHGTNDPLTINRIYRGIGEDGDIQLSGQISKTFIDFLKNNNDPRLPVLSYVYPPDFSPGDDPGGGSSDPADQNGLPNGYDAGNTSHGIQSYLGPPPYLGNINLYSRPSPIIFNATAPTLILTYAESEFLLADAAKRWGIGSAVDHYNNGVRAAMTELAVYGDGGSIADGDIDDYLAAHPYDDSKGLAMINTQFWACTFFNEYEAWANYRRTGFPVLKAVTYTGSQSPGAIPRRMYYSSVDKQVNTTNYNAAAAAMGGDKIISRMWWDVQ
jgi:hypothetical protein